MPGPLPKDPAVRQRMNKSATNATLRTDADKKQRIPKLPKITENVEGVGEVSRDWHPLTRQWWRDVWRSPMAPEFLQADIHALYRLAALVDKFWNEPNKDLAAEIRLEQQCFGLTPIDRRRLQWTVEKAEEASRKTKRRAMAEAEPIDDPRSVLRVVNG